MRVVTQIGRYSCVDGTNGLMQVHLDKKVLDNKYCTI